jgi:hypothetical protein
MERFGLTSLDDLPPLDPEVAARVAASEDEDEVEQDHEAGSLEPIDDEDG